MAALVPYTVLAAAVAGLNGPSKAPPTCEFVTALCLSGAATKIATFNTTDPRACCQYCQQDRRCLHWQIPQEIKLCHLRTGGSLGEKMCIRDNSTVAPPGPNPPPPTPPPAPLVPPAPPVAPPLGFKPNIVFFLADDYGHYNAGFRGNKEARTSNMDQLVADGVLLDRHYVYQYCSPTRSSFLSGRLPIHVNTANRAAPVPGGVHIQMTTVANKMQLAGYYTVQSGKWHAGSGCTAAIPTARGFNKSLGYLSGAEDHFDQTIGGNIVDLWENEGPAYGQNGTYGGYIYANHTLQAIRDCPEGTPLFIYHAFQECHTPNEVPESYLQPSIDYPLRQVYEGMAHFMDVHIGNIVDALKEKDMWKNTLVVFSSDNGGREDQEFGGNNFPLRGMKFTDFEGGTRVTAWASGGVIPPTARGTVLSSLIHICDWYHTFSYLAGVDPVDHLAAAHDLPATDSLNVWPAISDPTHNTSTGRSTIVLSSNSIIMWPYKLVLGKQGGKGWWSSPIHPNKTQPSIKDSNAGCPSGCVFDISSDPSEYVDLSSSFAEIKKYLQGNLSLIMATAYQTNDQPGYDSCVSVPEYVAAHHNFMGPPCNKSSE